MTKREKARLLIEMWMVKHGDTPQIAPRKFKEDLAAFEQAVRDEEAEECAKLAERRFLGDKPLVAAHAAIRARIAKRNTKGEANET